MRLRMLLAIGMLAWVSGCRNDGTPGGTSGAHSGRSGATRIALLMKARTNPFFDRMAAGAERLAREQGVDLTVLAIDKETDAAKQADQVETVIAQGVAAILIAPVDSKAIIQPLLQAQARGIRILNLDNRIDPAAASAAGLQIAAFIGPDNVEGARKSAGAMIEKIGGEGEVAMLEGIRGVDNAEARKKGFQLAVESANGKVKVVAMDSGEWMTEPAQKKMEAILNSHPNLKGVFCANDMMALGVIQAIASAGKTGQIVVSAYDNLEPARQAIKAGSLYATVEQHPDRMGELGVETALKVIRGETVPPVVPVPTDLITTANLTQP